MKRLHVNVGVNDIDASVRFYRELFDTQPIIVKQDYARWMLDDPRVNFAITTRGSRKGVNHLGIQVEDETELAEIYQRLDRADTQITDEGITTCCYANSSKRWVADPQGVDWENFLTHGESATYGQDQRVTAPAESSQAASQKTSQKTSQRSCC